MTFEDYHRTCILAPLRLVDYKLRLPMWPPGDSWINISLTFWSLRAQNHQRTHIQTSDSRITRVLIFWPPLYSWITTVWASLRLVDYNRLTLLASMILF